ncbi:hypothetical protein [Streptomyces sp. NBC_01022]|uniref:hypothetical protein n=1 Tax=Streptomyces sp. NBC_01022 TaxID=2903723 RepID=UPI002DDAA56B|nr:hypothetical protein [Streptomyces sp. NBC_01022]WRZ82664.1 hypothetical protein OG316_21570 [Streptomyces sp. NBC_01022]
MRLEWLAMEVMHGLPSDEARVAVKGLLAEVAAHPDWLPDPGGDEITAVFGSQCWVSLVTYVDEVEVRDVGWAG